MTTPTSAMPGDATTAGNYFVSNYPPYSFWQPEHVPQALAALDQPPRPGNPLGLYVHIPFCRKRCHFCYFKVYTEKKSSEVHQYIDAALAELDHYLQHPFLGGRKPLFIYFGGGTPSYLSTSQFTSLVEELRRRLPWDAAEEITMECEPGTLTAKKVETIRQLGITRLSLGVENFDERLLELNGRAHRLKEIERAYGWVQAQGFQQVNIDLIAGMLEETDENWQRCIDRTLAMAPDSVTIYQMEVPFNTTLYQRMKESGQLTAPVADWPTKRGWVDRAFRQLEDAGYTVGSAYTAVRDPRRTRFIYRDALWRGADLLSLGVASFGHLNGTHYQNEHSLDTYLERLGRGELPIFRALRPTPEELMLRELLLQWKLGRVDRAYFRDKFGIDPRERFAEAIASLAAEGFLDDQGETLCLHRHGLLQVDRLLHRFFLPQHRAARYA